MGTQRTKAELAIQEFYKYAGKPLEDHETFKAAMIAYDNVLKAFLSETVFVASHLEINNPVLQKIFEEKGTITEGALKEYNAKMMKLPLVLNNGESKYLAVFIREGDITAGKEQTTGVNCVEVKFLSQVYNDLVKGEDLDGIVINPYTKPFVIDPEHMEHLMNGCPHEALEAEIAKGLED